MLSDDDIVDIEKPGGIFLPAFVVNEFSELFSHPSIFSINYSRSALIINCALSDFWYWLNSNILQGLHKGF